MSINAVKGVEIGDGFACAEQRGEEYRDEITPQGFLSNWRRWHLGGIYRADIIAHIALKPLPFSSAFALLDGTPTEVITTGRHDPRYNLHCGKAMMATVLVDHALRNRGQNADVNS